MLRDDGSAVPASLKDRQDLEERLLACQRLAEATQTAEEFAAGLGGVAG